MKPLIYTLFPTLAGRFEQWDEHLSRIRDMGFNWVHLCPVQAPGYSGNIFAIRDLYRLNPALLSEGQSDALTSLTPIIDQAHRLGLKVLFDLVLTHASKDAPLTSAQPDWFRRQANGELADFQVPDPDQPTGLRRCEDMAEFDNFHASNRAELWAHWTSYVQYLSTLGIDGFRCDAAHRVPTELWQHLLPAARARYPNLVFVAEALGAGLGETESLQRIPFDYLFNSSKWWQFDQPWCLEQHNQPSRAPSVSFPETHSSSRLMNDSGGRPLVSRQRYAFAAVFSGAALMPIGFEFGFRNPVDASGDGGTNREAPNSDLSAFVSTVNRLVSRHPIMQVEGQWRPLSPLNQQSLLLEKSDPELGPMAIAINKSWDEPTQISIDDEKWDPFATVLRVCHIPGSSHQLGSTPITLAPAEVAYILPS